MEIKMRPVLQSTPIDSPRVGATAARQAAALSPRPPRHYSWRLGVHTVLAAVLLVLSAPVLAVVAVLVKLSSRGPVIYSQTRLGQGGRHFRIYKFRTMWHNCERVSGACWSAPGDPRVTGVGRFLRWSHLDELPQLWNVLHGDMSLVGPRPERPEFLPQLEHALPHYRRRLQVRPGVTGLAQVQLAADTDLSSVRRKLAYDLYYIEHSGIGLDLRLIACTGLAAAGLPYRWLQALLRIPGPAAVERHPSVRPPHAATIARMEALS
jgi:lipopolysaccharide/colanic/teichoic acid biosynthesis glycosyltransferase